MIKLKNLVEANQNPLKKYKNYDKKIDGIDVDVSDKKMLVAGDYTFELLPSAKIKEGDLYFDNSMGTIYWWEPEDWSLDLTDKKQYTKVKPVK